MRPCGCTYRDTGNPFVETSVIRVGPRSVRLALIDKDGVATWGHLCNALRCNTDDKRDALHRVLHRIATPTITPAEGRGRRGTLWTLNR